MGEDINNSMTGIVDRVNKSSHNDHRV